MSRAPLCVLILATIVCAVAADRGARAAGGASAEDFRPEPEGNDQSLFCHPVGTPDYIIEICLHKAAAATSPTDRTLLGRGPYGSDVVLTTSAQGQEDFLYFRTPPPQPNIEYSLGLPRGARVAANDGSAIVLDKQGRPRLRVERPWILDATGAKFVASLSVLGCDGRPPCRLVVDWSNHPATYPVLVDPEWKPVTDVHMCSTRQFHTATLLGPDANYSPGSVLIIGGLDDQGQPTNSVSLFNPNMSNSLTDCKSLLQARAYHTATWVRVNTDAGMQGRVLVVGGYGSCPSPPCTPDQMPALDTYELYDPEDCRMGQVCPGAPPHGGQLGNLPGNVARAEHSATVLGGAADENASILIVGGSDAESPVLRFEPGGSWTTLAVQVAPRFGHTATYVTSTPGALSSDPNAVVFVAGGSVGRVSGSGTAVDTDLILGPPWDKPFIIPHDPDAGAGEARPARSHAASVLDSIRVLLTGGNDSASASIVDFGAFFQDPSSPPPRARISWDSPTSHTVAVDTLAIPALHGALLVGGMSVDSSCQPVGDTPFYDGKYWVNPAPQLSTPRMNHTVTPILNGKSVVAVGGATSTSSTSNACLHRMPLNTLETLAIGELGDSCENNIECVSGNCSVAVGDGGAIGQRVCCPLGCPQGACGGCAPDGECVLLPSGTACGAPTSCGARAACNGSNPDCPAVTSDSCDSGPDGPPDAPVDAPADAPPDAPADAPADAPPDGPNPRGPPGPRQSFLSCSLGLSGRVDSTGLWFLGLVPAVALARCKTRRAQTMGSP